MLARSVLGYLARAAVAAAVAHARSVVVEVVELVLANELEGEEAGFDKVKRTLSKKGKEAHEVFRELSEGGGKVSRCESIHVQKKCFPS